MKTSSNLTFF